MDDEELSSILGRTVERLEDGKIRIRSPQGSGAPLLGGALAAMAVAVVALNTHHLGAVPPHRFQLVRLAIIAVAAAGAVVALGYGAWCQWSREEWILSPESAELRQTFLGRAWSTLYPRPVWEIERVSGGAAHDLLIAGGGKRTAIYSDRYDESVRSLGLELSEQTGWTLRTVR